MPGYISKVSWSNSGSPSFVEIAVPTGTDVSGYTLVVYTSNGRVDATYSFGSINSSGQGVDVYTVQNAPTGSLPVVGTDAFALVDDTGSVLQFISQSSGITANQGPADGMAATDIGQAPGGTSLQSNNAGASYYQRPEENPGTVPCFAPGTLISTPAGFRPVERLRAGDQVDTFDHGPVRVRWVSKSIEALEGTDFDARPVRIGAGAFGPGRPVRDLVVSPQHRILTGGAGQLDQLTGGQRLVPAKSLVGLPRIRRMMGKKAITWVHFALDRHEVVIAEGCLAESLLLGPMVVRRLPLRQRRYLTDAFGVSPGTRSALNGPPARDCLRGEEARRLLATLARDDLSRALSPA